MVQNLDMARSAVADPMSRATLVVLALVAVTALAGCSKAPPSGELASGASAVAIDGSATVVYVEEVRPAGSVPVPGVPDLACGPAGSPQQVQCVDASSSFTIHFMALPTPEGQYEVVLVNATGSVPLGALVADANNMYELNTTIAEDYTGRFDRLELRMGEFVLATATPAEGTNPFSPAPGLDAVSATGSYRGKVLNVTVSGLPANATYTGYLYTLDETSGLLTRNEPFPVQNGANEYTAPLNIKEYAEFHIHVGTSMVNVYKTTIPQA
jgi:hypothetical protein